MQSAKGNNGRLRVPACKQGDDFGLATNFAVRPGTPCTLKPQQTLPSW